MKLVSLMCFSCLALSACAENKSFSSYPDTLQYSHFLEVESPKVPPRAYYVSTGYNYSSGDYGRSTTSTAHSIPVTLRVQDGNISGRLTVPVVSMHGTGIGLDGVPSNSLLDKESATGFGNVQMGLAYKEKLNRRGTSGEISGRIEIPTANSNHRLGADTPSVLLQVGINQKITRKIFTNVSVGRKFTGSTNTYPLNDTWKANIGAGYKVSPRMTAGGSLELRTPASDTSHPYQVGTAYVQYRVNPKTSVQGYVGAGLTQSSPDFITGVEVTRKVDLDW